ncbi:PIN domain-containing protein [Lewinella cohaerens]|uniref:PIN domain-containing protein n=1 Tax=Lewinella cohaerens TaxID=70995 RepID=UPI00036259A1|nr:PIN domain-containing protein [Lewinella cohaerens]
MRVVLDTNSLLVSIGSKSKYRPIFDALLNGVITLLITNDIINEYVEIIGQRTNAIVADNASDLLMSSPSVEKVKVYFKWSIISQDADDNKFVDCALNGRASFLVTDDKHFNVLKDIGFPPVQIIRTKDFLKEVEKLQKLKE